MHSAPAFALAALLLSAGAALACDGQQGKPVFQDDFSDDSGGWYIVKDHMSYKDNSLIVRPNLGAKDAAVVTTSLIYTFSQTDGDYCVDLILPKFTEADNNVGAGVEFWAKDGLNLYNFIVFTNKTVGLYRLINNSWTTIYQELNNANVKTDPGAVNSLHVVAKSGKLTTSINGAPFKTIRAQAPDGETHFGIYGSVSKATDADTTITFKNFSVTAGQ